MYCLRAVHATHYEEAHFGQRRPLTDADIQPYRTISTEECSGELADLIGTTGWDMQSHFRFRESAYPELASRTGLLTCLSTSMTPGPCNRNPCPRHYSSLTLRTAPTRNTRNAAITPAV